MNLIHKFVKGKETVARALSNRPELSDCGRFYIVNSSEIIDSTLIEKEILLPTTFGKGLLLST